MSDTEHSAIAADARSGAASPAHAAEPAAEGAVPFHTALEKAAADIARGMFQPVVISLVSLLAFGFAGMKVALYLAQ